jgi:hypothetical protein
MLIVTQRSFSSKHEQVIGYFQDIRTIYNHFGDVYGKYGLESRFSHNQFEVINTGRYWLCWRQEELATEHAMVITNQQGIRYSKEFVAGIFNKFRKKPIYRRYWTGSNRHYRCCYRGIRTTQERTLSLGVLKEEGEPVWRTSRNMHNLPNRWDDIHHLDVCNRNWKRFRKTQWK